MTSKAKKKYPLYKCVQSFTIYAGRKGEYTVNEGEIWELRDDIDILLARNKIGIRIMPWQFECFEKLAESEEE